MSKFTVLKSQTRNVLDQYTEKFEAVIDPLKDAFPESANHIDGAFEDLKAACDRFNDALAVYFDRLAESDHPTTRQQTRRHIRQLRRGNR